ncbi:MAG: hypothetical protein JEY99_00275 [Spirochaetales bacterium]|nr:hypothetical protein [Spirochaetales bacterium]
MHKRLIFSFFTAALFLGSCGIPSIPFIEPPEANSIPEYTSFSVSFKNAEDNNPLYFQGYALYYRFFSDQEKLATVVDSLASADDRSDLLAKEYRFLYQMEDNTGFPTEGYTPSKTMTIPVDLLDRNKTFNLTLDFNGDIVAAGDEINLFGTTITSSISGIFTDNILYVGRYIGQDREDDDNDVEVVKSFNEYAYSIDDADIPDDFNFDTNTLYLSVYVISFGQDTIGLSIFSKPVNLGKFQLNVNTL